MNVQNAYAVIYPPEEFKEDTLVFLETKEEVNALISELHEKRTRTNQRFSYFAKVFPKGALYPAEYHAFWQERRNKDRKSYHVVGDFFVQRTLKSGKIKSKYYGFAEGFVDNLDEWNEKGAKDIYILDTNESLSGDYYYERDIQKLWGEKDKPLLA